MTGQNVLGQVDGIPAIEPSLRRLQRVPCRDTNMKDRPGSDLVGAQATTNGAVLGIRRKLILGVKEPEMVAEERGQAISRAAGATTMKAGGRCGAWCEGLPCGVTLANFRTPPRKRSVVRRRAASGTTGGVAGRGDGVGLGSTTGMMNGMNGSVIPSLYFVPLVFVRPAVGRARPISQYSCLTPNPALLLRSPPGPPSRHAPL